MTRASGTSTSAFLTSDSRPALHYNRGAWCLTRCWHAGAPHPDPRRVPLRRDLHACARTSPSMSSRAVTVSRIHAGESRRAPHRLRPPLQPLRASRGRSSWSGTLFVRGSSVSHVIAPSRRLPTVASRAPAAASVARPTRQALLSGLARFVRARTTCSASPGEAGLGLRRVGERVERRCRSRWRHRTCSLGGQDERGREHREHRDIRLLATAPGSTPSRSGRPLAE